MKLDRNTNPNGHGKYAVLKLRSGIADGHSNASACVNLLKQSGALNFGTEPGEEFFVIKLRDKYAANALLAYARAAEADGETEYADEINDLAVKSAGLSNRKKPD